MQPGPGYQFTNISSSPGDEKTKKLWELWDKLSKAEQEWRAACEREKDLRREASSASCAAGNALTRLKSAREALDHALAIPAETRGEPVTRE